MAKQIGFIDDFFDASSENRLFDSKFSVSRMILPVVNYSVTPAQHLITFNK